MVYVDLIFNTPLRRSFTYSFPEELGQAFCSQRVRCRFGKQKQAIGIVFHIHDTKPPGDFKISAIESVIDQQPIVSDDVWQLIKWSADYYTHPVGEAVFSCLPVKLRQGEPANYQSELVLKITAKEPNFKSNATKLKQTYQDISQHLIRLSQKSEFGIAKATIDKLLAQELITVESEQLIRPSTKHNDKPEKLSEEQTQVLAKIDYQRYQSLLIQGITGSGKTEIFLQAIETCLEKNQSALILVPEIGLTPQTLHRFRDRFDARIEVLHSQLSDSQRLHIWLKCLNNQVDILIGTRSSIYSPLTNLGIIIIDEEHDPSYKQQEGFRYHARDLACKRAHQADIPVLLASATPSLETLANTQLNNFEVAYLSKRLSGNLAPIKTVNMTTEPSSHGISHHLMSAIKHYLAKEQQVLLFINKRGFSPVLRCEECNWLSECKRCDANMTYHKRHNQMRCHHCGNQHQKPHYCPQCLTGELIPLGLGTEKVDEWLQQKFPEKHVVRVDRDTASTKNKLEGRLTQIHDGHADIIIGTQMLAKGHHFKNLGLVGILDVDGSFFTADFRGSERLSQLVLQVAGRAGRELTDSEVILQTHYPDHPLIERIQQQDYAKISQWLLQERQDAMLPPYRHQTVIRANCHQFNHAMNFLQDVKQIIQINQTQTSDQVSLIGPMPAPIEKRAGKFRCYLILEANQRSSLRNSLQTNMHLITNSAFANKVRWYIDVDPKELL
jgi:primosomal protein N' (replication factor Y) (superfamily II helicase)